ncbi:glycoside hydrolase family 38 C-terminal domain-containing protein, partial [Jatrophihabitans endophyticus]|uniref:alpha-mannosidase n=1 Tax=Jatrophihabitans endophyticus TaxID=1206085 RepID=UPI0019DD4D19
LRDFEGLPRVTPEKVSAFLPKAAADARDLPVWSGELYLELHRGTYTTQAAVKRANRRCERLLHDAELYAALAPDAGVDRVDAPRPVHDVARPDEHTVPAYLERAWKLLLLNQFHDIIPGSSIGWVYEDAACDYATIERLCEAVAGPARRALAARIATGTAQSELAVFNPGGFDRQEVASLPDGTPAFVTVPMCGYAVHAPDASAHDLPPVSVSLEDGSAILDNGIVRAVFDADGRLVSLRDHRVDREIVAPGERGNVFELRQDYPNNHDAWDIDPFVLEAGGEISAETDPLEIVENHPLRAVVRVSRRFGSSGLVQRICLRAGSARLDFETEVDWHENRRLLQVAFPVNVRSLRATFETQFGHVERPTHRNTSWDAARFEVCAHRWADLSEGDGYGVALLNDSKYGHSVLGHTLRLSLLRAPAEPDPSADRGRHRFTYALFPHPGDFRAGRVVAEAAALNAPLDLVAIDSGAAGSESFFSVDQPNVVLDTIKPAEREEAVIVRMYEAHGTRCRVAFRTSLPVREMARADLLERTQETVAHENGATTLEVAPFEIVTLKIVRG